DFNGDIEIVYDPLASINNFVVGGTLRIWDQHLPIPGVDLDDSFEILFSFSWQADSVTPDTNGEFIASFVASGDGQIQGTVVPQPAAATLGLLALGGLGAMTRRRRRA
ncbi:MAG: hypothetical protein MI741_22820, partial [Rhodospirillales bacterium]|nr:hypothetical protein [Rhodospirillales bacterium]